MKGQMYLLAAAILITVIATSLLFLKPVSIDIGERTAEIQIEDKITENIVNELQFAWEAGYPNPEVMKSNTWDFASYLVKDLRGRAYDAGFFYLAIVGNYTGKYVNVSVVNLLEDGLNVTVELNGTVKSSLLSYNSTWNVSYQGLSNDVYQLEILYENYSKSFNLNLSSDFYTAYLDTRISSKNAYHRKTVEKNYSLA